MAENQIETLTQHQDTFTLTALPSTPGSFEILCITAGDGNGWQFSEDVLQASLGLWEGVHCFIDHAWASRSVRDLAGQISNARWDPDARGIRAALKPFGPGADLLRQFGGEVLAAEAPPRVGFSADIVFKASQKRVQRILKVASIDLVYNPARGGAFLRALNQQKGSDPMTDEKETSPVKENEAENPVLTQLQADQEAMRSLLREEGARARGGRGRRRGEWLLGSLKRLFGRTE